MRRLTLSNLSTLASQLLAVFGLVTLAFTGGTWIYKTLSFKDALAIARPICERLLFPVTGVVDVPTDGSWRLVGISILSIQGLPDARIRIRDFNPVVSWAVYSDGLAPAEKEAILRALPTGTRNEVFTSETLPTLPKESVTTLLAVAKPEHDLEGLCEPDFIEVLTSAGEVYHVDPNRLTFRGWYFGVSPIYYVGVYVLAVAGFFYFLYFRRGRRRPS